MPRHRHARKRRHAPGTPPGTLVPAPQSAAPRIRIVAYSAEQCVEREITSVDDIEGFLREWPVTWVNVDGLGDIETLRRLGEIFNIHGLALEDVLSLHQRPKLEAYDKNLFVVLRMPEQNAELQTEQLSVFIGPNFLLTLQEEPLHDCLDPVRRRIQQNTGHMRAAGTDYLAYALIDAVIDAYFPPLDAISDRIEALETEVVEQPTRETVSRIHEVKRDLLTIRRGVGPLRDVINMLLREEEDIITPATRIYIRDCYDHVFQIMDLVETYRELASGLLDIYLSSVSNRLNEIMKVLTIITTIFIPLSFLAGVYGMNFRTDISPYNMPELTWRYGYVFFLSIVVSVAVLQLVLFWRKGWLGGSTPKKKKDSESFP